MTARSEEVRAGLADVHDRVRRVCEESERDAGEVTVVVVTKFFPASDVRLLADLGVRHVAENRHQEAAAKREDCADLDLTWHFVGGLQSNKAAAVAGWADVVQSLDRPRLLAGLSRGAVERGRPLDVLVQVSLDPPQAQGRSGVGQDDLTTLVDATLGTEWLRLRGLMGVAPLGGDPDAAFARLSELSRQVRRQAPEARWISAGMSGDLEQALRHGATHVRVGSAVLGNRPARG